MRQVMSTPGIFGEKLEIEALSSIMGRKIQVFYYHGEKVRKGIHPKAGTNSHPFMFMAYSNCPFGEAWFDQMSVLFVLFGLFPPCS